MGVILPRLGNGIHGVGIVETQYQKSNCVDMRLKLGLDMW